MNRRVVEIGIRMALGATRGEVSWIVLRDCLIMVAGGLVFGLPLAWIGSKVMASMLYELSPHDPLSLAVAAIGVLAVSLASALFPARKAAGVQPLDALRAE